MDAAAAIVDALPDPMAEVELRRQLCAEAARDAYRLGYRQGYERGARLREADFAEHVGPLTEPQPTHQELETLRYGPGGRERFGDPRPGDRMPQTRGETAA